MTPAILYNRMMAKSRLRHLQLVLYIADLQSLQKAAEAVGMSQPGATHALAEFETILETPLFYRHAKGMRPTSAGLALLPLIRQALGQIQAGAQAIAYLGAGASDTVRVGAINAAMSSVLADLLPEFTERHGDIAVEAVPLSAEEISEALVNRSVDIVISRRPPDLPAHHDFLPLLADRYAVVCGRDHPYVSQASIELADLKRAAWLVPPPAGIAARDFEHLCLTLGMGPTACWVSAKSILLTLALLQKRELLALIPLNAVIQLIHSGLIVELMCRDLQQPALAPLGIVYPMDRDRRSRSASTLIEYATEMFHPTIAAGTG